MTNDALPALNNDVQLRILGALIEKETTTPDAYPLTLNALTNACNQSTNRDPVVDYAEADVERELETLRRANLVHRVERGESRVVRHRHVIDEALALDRPALAVLAVLMLRGPQTAGEIRSRCQRLHDFPTLGDLDRTLAALRSREGGALLRDLPRRPGQKEARLTHCLGHDGQDDPAPPDDAEARPDDTSRIDRLEEVVAGLGREVADLRDQLEHLRRQFE